MKQAGRIIFILVLGIVMIPFGRFTIHSEETYGTCPNCGGNLIFYDEVPGMEPTCSSGGMIMVVCENHDYDQYANVGALGHDYAEEIAIDPTCSEEGVMEHVCSRCGDVYDTAIAALGHDYQKSVKTPASCTSSGILNYICSRCDHSYSETIKALGHDYKSKVTKEATCEEDGEKTYTCSRCNNSYKEVIKASGHDVDYEEKAASCLSDGYKKGVCKVCHQEFNEVLSALGHLPGPFKTVVEASCSKQGLKEAECMRCKQKLTETIPKKDHEYPEEWIVEKEASFFSQGLEYKNCKVCNERLEQVIPHRNRTPLAVASSLAVVALGLWYYLKRTKVLKKKLMEEDKEFIKPEFEDKTILISSKDEDLLDLLKTKHFLNVNSCEDEEIADQLEEIEPDLLIVDVLSEERLEEFKEQLDDFLKEQAVAIISVEEFIADHHAELDELVKAKRIISFLPYKSESNDIMIKLILPVLKPDLRSDESLGNIGAVADFMGIPGVSKVIGAFVSARDIKAVLDEGEISVLGVSTIIGSIASILGFEKTAAVAGLMDDLDAIRSAVNKEAGANEAKGAISGAKDMIEVVSDLVNRE